MVGLDGAAQQPARPDDMLLADELVQRARAHPRRQRRFLLQPFLVGLVKEVHRTSIAQMTYVTDEKRLGNRRRACS